MRMCSVYGDWQGQRRAVDWHSKSKKLRERLGDLRRRYGSPLTHIGDVVGELGAQQPSSAACQQNVTEFA